jgi:hypothetical protein
MKQTPQDREHSLRLQPSKFSAEGFMGTDNRTFDEIVSQDTHELARLSISPEEIVNALTNAYEMAQAGLGNPVTIRPGITAMFYESMGRIPSPFREDGLFRKGEAVITDDNSRETISITALSISLIEKHGFYQGLGSPYRIDPAVAARLLGLMKA